MRSILTVTSPVDETSLLTLTELRDATGMSSGGEASLMRLGRRISAAIARACGVAGDGANPPTLLRETCSEVFRTTVANERLRLSRRPIGTVSAAQENTTVLTASDYEVEPVTGFLFRLSNDTPIDWACGKITVSYTAGLVTVPPDLQEAAIKVAASIHAHDSREPGLKRDRTDGVGEFEYWVPPADDPLLSAAVQDLLEPYKQYWI